MHFFVSPVQSQLIAHVGDVVVLAVRNPAAAHGAVVALLLARPVVAGLGRREEKGGGDRGEKWQKIRVKLA